jgi:hypothetical protein
MNNYLAVLHTAEKIMSKAERRFKYAYVIMVAKEIIYAKTVKLLQQKQQIITTAHRFYSGECGCELAVNAKILSSPIRTGNGLINSSNNR